MIFKAGYNTVEYKKVCHLPLSVINRSQFFAFFVIITDGTDGAVSNFSCKLNLEIG